MSNLPVCILCQEEIRQFDVYYQNRHVHEDCYEKLSPEQKEADPFKAPEVPVQPEGV